MALAADLIAEGFSLERRHVHVGEIYPPRAPQFTFRFAPRFESKDDDPRAAAVIELAAEKVQNAGKRTYSDSDDCLSAGRTAVAEALEELELWGAHITPPRIRVIARRVMAES
jgi:hypothetical protein